MLRVLVVLLAALCGALGVIALGIAALAWREIRRNVGLPEHPSPSGHGRRVLRYAYASPAVALECVPTVTDTEAVVVWATAVPTSTAARVHAADGPVRDCAADVPPTRWHRLRLDGLQPETRYRVQLGAPGGEDGPTVTFTTPPTFGPVKFRFAVLTDTHFKRDALTWPDGRLYRRAREVHERLLSQMLRHDPAFIIHKGDCTEPTGPHRLAAYGDAWRRCPVPIHFIPGNHDYLHHPNFTADWTALTGRADTYGSFTHGGVAFILMDTSWSGEQERGYFGARQLRWLRDTLRAHRRARTLIVTHHPVFGGARENRACHDADAFCAVVAEHGRVGAVLSGHVHRNLVRWSERLPGVPNIETASGIQYPIGFALYEVGARGFRQTFHVIDDVALSMESWRRSWLRSVTNPSDPVGRPDHRNFVLPWPPAGRGAR